MSERTTEMERVASWDNDPATRGKVIDSIVLRGDLSGLGPGERARFYIQMCEGLGLNPTSQPFAFLRLNGKEILYATRGCTDQLAAMHRINRRIIDGPKVIDLAGTKLVYAVAEATMPNGRVETATATIPLTDPANVLMKCETKAKRRVTMSILGLALLDEMEIETIPASAQSPGGGVDLARASDPRGEPVHEATVDETPGPLAAFYAHVGQIELPGEAVAVWMKHRPALNLATPADREAAWKAICTRTEEVGRMKNAKVWLKKALAEEDARKAGGNGVDPTSGARTDAAPRAREPGDDDDQPDPPAGGSGGSSSTRSSSAKGSAVASAPASGPVGLVEPWMESEASVRGYLSQRAHWNALENAVRKHTAAMPPKLREAWLRLAGWRLQALAITEGQEIPLDGKHGCKALVAKWAAEGPVGRASGVRKAA